jgi:hypothetical protein
VALQRRGYAQERIGARVVELGFAAVEADLVDRLLERTGRWPMLLRSLARMERRCGGGRGWSGCSGGGGPPNRWPRASGPPGAVVSWQARRAARLAPTVAVEAVMAWLDAGQPHRERAAQRIGRALDGVIRAAQPLIE